MSRVVRFVEKGPGVAEMSTRNEPVIVIQGGMIRLRRRGHQCVGRQRVCVRT